MPSYNLGASKKKHLRTLSKGSICLCAFIYVMPFFFALWIRFTIVCLVVDGGLVVGGGWTYFLWRKKYTVIGVYILDLCSGLGIEPVLCLF